MAMTKVEAAKLTQDMMLRGVIETIVTESMILELLPFMQLRMEVVTVRCRSLRSGSSVGWMRGPVSPMSRPRCRALTGARSGCPQRP
jgi:hypothetical protein